MRKLLNFLKPGVLGNAYIAGAIIGGSSFSEDLDWIYSLALYIVGIAFCLRAMSLHTAEEARNYKNGYFDGQREGYSDGYDDGRDEGYSDGYDDGQHDER